MCVEKEKKQERGRGGGGGGGGKETFYWCCLYRTYVYNVVHITMVDFFRSEVHCTSLTYLVTFKYTQVLKSV